MEIQNLLNYYLECIAKDIDIEVKEFQIGYDLKYEQLDILPNHIMEIQNNKNAIRLLENLNREKNKMAYVGYPIYIKERISKNNKKYRTVEPLFLFPVEKEEIKIDKLKINKSIIVTLLNTKSNLEIMNEILEIYKDIEYYNEDTDYKTSIESIYKKRSNYPFCEKINIDKLSNINIKKITEDGIYNIAAMFITEKSKYTEGLEQELIELKNLSKEKGNSILDLLVNSKGYIENAIKQEDLEILKALPTNIEQEKAIKKALSSRVTLIKGPPGTGKSQVVTSLIINAIYNNKSVLFSSKNHKAVDVVCERLNSISKYPIMLELKSSSDISNLLIPYLDNIINSNFKLDVNYYKALIYALRNKKNKIENKDYELEEISKNIEEIKRLKEQSKEIKDKILYLDKFKNNINLIDTLDTSSLEEKINSLQDKNIINKLKLVFNKNKIKEEIKQEIKNINNIFEELGCNKIFKVKEIEKIFEIKESIQKLKLLRSYYELLEKYNANRDIVEVIKEKDKLEEEYNALSKEVLEKFLEMKSLNLEYEDKKNLNSYKNMLSMLSKDTNCLFNKSFLNNYNNLSLSVNNIMPAMAVTSLSIRGKYPLTRESIDLVIIDEASQCDIASAIPLLYRAKNIVVIGDDKQLEHITNIDIKENIELLNKYNIYENLAWDYKNNSIYSLIDSYLKEEEKITLKEHHRSNGDIIGFSNNYYYNNNLKVATKYKNLNKLSDESIIFENTSGDTKKYNGASAINLEEIEKVIFKLKEIKESGYKGTVGVLTPFRGQADAIIKRVSKEEDLEEMFDLNSLLIDTVNKFQGDEKDVIIFSLCVSNGISSGAINFLKNTEKLFNVALTRAKSNLIVIGNKDYIEKTDIKYIKEFINYYNKLKEKKKEEKTLNEMFENTNGIYPKFSNIESIELEKKLYEKLYNNNIKSRIKYKLDDYYIDLVVENDNGKTAIIVDKGESIKEDKILINKLLENGYIVKKVYDFQVEDNFEKILENFI